RAALAADEVKQHLLALGLQFEGFVARSLDDVRVERAGQATVAVKHDEQVRVALSGAREQLRRRIRAADLRCEARDNAFEALGIGARGLGRGLSLAQLCCGDHFLGLGDLLGRLDRDDAPFEFLKRCHYGPSCSSARRNRPGSRSHLAYAKILANASSASTRPFLASSPRSLLSRMAFSTCGWSLRRSEEHTSELQSRENLVCRLLLEKKI